MKKNREGGFAIVIFAAIVAIVVVAGYLFYESTRNVSGAAQVVEYLAEPFDDADVSIIGHTGAAIKSNIQAAPGSGYIYLEDGEMKMKKDDAEKAEKAAQSHYIGERCIYCGEAFNNLDDLKTAVYAGDHKRGRLAHKTCWDKNR